jgi:uncharacterized RDD family membrane protein YckC
VVSGQRESPGLGRSVRRWAAFEGVRTVVAGAVPWAALTWFVIVGASIIRDSERRGIHDRFAGTRVVSTRRVGPEKFR